MRKMGLRRNCVGRVEGAMDLDDEQFAPFVKALEKMGWSRGKGLGKSEQGMTHVDIMTPLDKSGVGGRCVRLKTAAEKKPKAEPAPKDTKKTDTIAIEAIDITLESRKGRRQRAKLQRVAEQERALHD